MQHTEQLPITQPAATRFASAARRRLADTNSATRFASAAERRLADTNYATRLASAAPKRLAANNYATRLATATHGRLAATNYATRFARAQKTGSCQLRKQVCKGNRQKRAATNYAACRNQVCKCSTQKTGSYQLRNQVCNYATCRNQVCKCSTRSNYQFRNLPQPGLQVQHAEDWQIPIPLPDLQVQQKEDWQIPITQHVSQVQHPKDWQLTITQPGLQLQHTEDWQQPITQEGLQRQQTEEGSYQLRNLPQPGLQVQHTEDWQLPITQCNTQKTSRFRLLNQVCRCSDHWQLPTMQQAAFRITQPDQQRAQYGLQNHRLRRPKSCQAHTNLSAATRCLQPDGLCCSSSFGPTRSTVPASVSSAAVNRSAVPPFLPSCPPSYFLPSFLRIFPNCCFLPCFLPSWSPKAQKCKRTKKYQTRTPAPLKVLSIRDR